MLVQPPKKTKQKKQTKTKQEVKGLNPSSDMILMLELDLI